MNGADGWSAVSGSCDKNSKGMTGSVVSLNGSLANSSNTFAHEMGHYLGLDHIAASDNFIGNNGASNSNTNIFDWQGNKMKSHCFVYFS
jgi:membrane peptidoglycan carboxypeptidase